jgi:hypothetical protein
MPRGSGLDGDERGPMASWLFLSLCGSDESRWRVAEQATNVLLRTTGSQ